MEHHFGRKPEILAPCGGQESIYAAVHSGADAVYLGQAAFNARKHANNFTGQDFFDAVAYCHLYGVKVYQTLNTLVFDSELDELKNCIRSGCEAGVDAFIVQDMGVLLLVKQLAPDMPIHASTQMTIHTPSGVRFLESLGVRRVVLARELSLNEIREIRAVSSMELEVFVHGALCVCVSGQCYMSGMLGGRSGNRGNCAQPCRLPFAVNGDGLPDLSLKDLSAVEQLDQLAEAGVSSFKIEGRMKRPEYVAAAVTACWKKLNGEEPDMDRLRAVFSRSGFTNAYLLDQRDRTMFGSRQKEDVVLAADVLKPLKQLYHKPVARVACEGELRVSAGESATYRLMDQDGNIAIATGEIPEIAQNLSLTFDSAKQYLSKLGGTPFFLEKLDGIVEDGLMVSAKGLNALRRTCVERLTLMRSKPRKKVYREHRMIFNPLPKEDQKLRFRVSDLKQLAGISPDDGVVIIPLFEVLKRPEVSKEYRVLLELPRVCFGQEELLKKGLEKAKAHGFSHVLLQNAGQLPLCESLGFVMSGGFGLNVTNSYAVDFYARAGLSDLTVSFELNLADAIKLVRTAKLDAIVYGHLPLMITRSCPIGKYRDCRECDKTGTLTDRKGNVFLVKCRDGVREIYNPDLLYLVDRLQEFSAFDSLTLYFTEESAEEIKRVVTEYKTQNGKRDKLTRGLYYRKV